MQKNIPRVLVAGTGSGCGKTTVTCALLKALVNRKLIVSAFKCGPDYIDPMFHSKVIGTKSSNLDSFFFDENTLKSLLIQNVFCSDISVIEGVMGFYDGLNIESTKASTYEISEITKTPVILVIDAKGAAMSILAVIEGFLNFEKNNQICGVILNRCTKMTYNMLAKKIEKHFSGKIKPLGFLPFDSDCAIKSRHLGLVTAEEIIDLKEKIDILAKTAEETINIDEIINIANNAVALDAEVQKIKKYDENIRLAVAKDEAFCFYYQDSLSILKSMGAEIVEFSPIFDKTLPENIHGIYLGGGYPELYKEKLSKNMEMKSSIRQALENKVPCIAECGGFMYLTEFIEDCPMVGFIKGRCFNNKKLTRFGYVTLEAKKDNMLSRAGDKIFAHEFHYYDAESNGDDYKAEKISGKSWDCVHATDYLYAGFPHFHFAANTKFAENFYKACLKEKHKND